MLPRLNMSPPAVPTDEGFYSAAVPAVPGRPVRTFLPAAYEHHYAYPLVVFFHGHGGNEEQVLRLAPRMSRRNYVCIGLRGPALLGQRADGTPAFGWDPDGAAGSDLEDYVFGAIEQTRRTYHIHSERIFLAGVCEGAAAAYRLGLTYPDRFGGLISLNGAMPRRGLPLLRPADLRGRRAFIGHGIANAVLPEAMARRDFRLLFAAGMDVRFCDYTTTHRLHPDMLRDLDRWIMEALDGEF